MDGVDDVAQRDRRTAIRHQNSPIAWLNSRRAPAILSNVLITVSQTDDAPFDRMLFSSGEFLAWLQAMNGLRNEVAGPRP